MVSEMKFGYSRCMFKLTFRQGGNLLEFEVSSLYYKRYICINYVFNCPNFVRYLHIVIYLLTIDFSQWYFNMLLKLSRKLYLYLEGTCCLFIKYNSILYDYMCTHLIIRWYGATHSLSYNTLFSRKDANCIVCQDNSCMRPFRWF